VSIEPKQFVKIVVGSRLVNIFRVEQLYHRARAIAGRLGYELCEGSTGGGSDGNFTAALGVPTLDGLGAVGAGAHALHEHIEVEALSWRAALLAALVAETHADAESLG